MRAKDELRREMASRRRAVDAFARDEASRRACAHLLDLAEMAEADTVALYAATTHELDPAPAVPALDSRGVRVAFPRVRADGLDLVVPESADDLRSGYRGVREPAGPPVDVEGIDVVVVPGLAFDHSGARLGQGGGHYDRLLAELSPATLRVGFCYALQIAPRVPVADHDEHVDVVVTEEASSRTGARDRT